MPRYSKDFIIEIKSRLKVSDVVGKFVKLTQRGNEYVGLSPFKNEKTPSFTVNDDKEFYHCFSSSEHGDIFSFLMKHKSMSYPEAIEDLAKQKEELALSEKIVQLHVNQCHKKLQSYASNSARHPIHLNH